MPTLTDEVWIGRRTRSSCCDIFARPSSRGVAWTDKIPEQWIETYSGDRREIDLDKYSFVLRNIETSPGQVMQIECQFLEELLEAAKDALDKRVTVTGSRPIDQTRRPKSLLVSRLEIIEDREQ